jgi:hypothetical protein
MKLTNKTIEEAPEEFKPILRQLLKLKKNEAKLHKILKPQPNENNRK